MANHYLAILALSLSLSAATSVFKTKDSDKKKEKTPRCPVPYDDQTPWQVWYSDPHDCNKYFVCDKEGFAVRMSCPAGLWWDNLSKTCMYVEYFPAKHQAHCFEKLRGIGTTPQLREIFIGRCWDYQLFKNPYVFKGGVRSTKHGRYKETAGHVSATAPSMDATRRQLVMFKDCDKLFEAFAKAFVGKAPCGQTEMSDYEELVQLSAMDVVPNRHLLWSGVYRLAQDYANLGEQAYTLESTLIGYILNDVTWCGQKDGDGINFDWCPAFASCKKHVMATFWAAATEQFARQAGGVVTAILNGSRTDGPAFRNNSFLAEHDIPNLNKGSVAMVRAWVVHDLEGPYIEWCSSSSLRVLENMVRAKGIKYECQDNPAPIVHHFCSKNPFYPYCTLIREQGGHSPAAPNPQGPIRLDGLAIPDNNNNNNNNNNKNNKNRGTTNSNTYKQATNNKYPQQASDTNNNNDNQPESNYQQPVNSNYQQQSNMYESPSNNYKQPDQQTSNNNNNHQQQSSNYQQQSNNNNNYQQQPSSYQQQQASNDGYQQQRPSNYQQQVVTYQQPAGSNNYKPQPSNNNNGLQHQQQAQQNPSYNQV